MGSGIEVRIDNGAEGVGTCQVCGKIAANLTRTDYIYNLPCECHGPNRLETVWHCKNASL